MANYEDRYWWSNDGLRLHYRDYPGDPARPPIICMPGLTRNVRDFGNVAARLAGDWRVICVEMRGRGDSGYAKDTMTYVPLTYLQDMEALLRDQAIDRFVAFGTSLGGLLTMLLASTQPGRVVAALLNDVGPEINPVGLARIREYVGQGRTYDTWMHAARAVADSQADIYPDYEVSDWLAYTKKLMKLTSSGRIVYDYDMKIAEPFQVPGGEAGVDLWPAMAALTAVPCLLVRGALSDVLDATVAQRMLESLPKAELLTIANCGHAPSLEEPESVAAIDRLLAKVTV